RPKNAWIFFRLDMHKLLRLEYPKATQIVLSKRISDLWRSAPSEVKSEYHRRARAAKDAHLTDYPGYKYAPR
ncbi:mating type protein 2, partial [Rhodocollybia butyracea]